MTENRYKFSGEALLLVHRKKKFLGQNLIEREIVESEDEQDMCLLREREAQDAQEQSPGPSSRKIATTKASLKHSSLWKKGCPSRNSHPPLSQDIHHSIRI